MKNLLLDWIDRKKTEHKLTQEKIGIALGIAQPSARSKILGITELTVEDIAKLEILFGEPSPIRSGGGEDGEVSVHVLRAVLYHLAQNYDFIDAEPHEFASVVIDLCAYAVKADKPNLTKAESGLALSRILERQG